MIPTFPGGQLVLNSPRLTSQSALAVRQEGKHVRLRGQRSGHEHGDRTVASLHGSP